MVAACKRIVESGLFQFFVLAVILLAAVLVGIETYESIAVRHHDLLTQLNRIVLWIFVVEAALKMLQHGKHFYRYFYDPWNQFDFTIVVVCFLPVNASYAAVLRLARIMRALRLMTALPQLQLIVGALIKSIPSMGYVGILLLLNFYVYAVMGVFLFGKNDPVHFHDLPTAMLSLFRVVTLEDWTDVMYIQMLGSDVYAYANTTNIVPQPRAMPFIGAAYFVTFVLFGTMIMLNLFIGVILNSMDETRAEREREQYRERRESGKEFSIIEDVEEIEHQIDDLRAHLDALRLRLESRSQPSDSMD
jgi:voltage-gated sodium channel